MGAYTRARDVGDAVVVEIFGRITLGEASTQLRDCIRDLLARKKIRIVLDLSQVSYVDSSGIGELVSAYTTTSNQGGKITLSHPRLRSLDLMTITKLSGTFEITSTVEEAISGIRSDRLMFLCCITGCETWMPYQASGGGYQVCTRCGSQSKLGAAGAKKNMSHVAVDHVLIPSYPDERVTVISGRPCRVEVHGRMDLFAFNSARKATDTVRAGVFDLTSATETTQKGCSALFELWKSTDSTGFLPAGRTLPAVTTGEYRILFDDWKEAERAHFAALERSAIRKGTKPVYERRLHTYLLR